MIFELLVTYMSLDWYKYMPWRLLPSPTPFKASVELSNVRILSSKRLVVPPPTGLSVTPSSTTLIFWNVTSVSLKYMPRPLNVIVGSVPSALLIVRLPFPAIVRPLVPTVISWPTSIVSPFCATLIASSRVSYVWVPIFATNDPAAGVGVGVGSPLLPEPPASPSCWLAAAVSSLPPLLSSANFCAFSVSSLLSSADFCAFSLPPFASTFTSLFSACWTFLPSLTTFTILFGVSDAASPSAPSCAASAVTGSMVSIINPARVPARKRLFLFFMQKTSSACIQTQRRREFCCSATGCPTE